MILTNCFLSLAYYPPPSLLIGSNKTIIICQIMAPNQSTHIRFHTWVFHLNRLGQLWYLEWQKDAEYCQWQLIRVFIKSSGHKKKISLNQLIWNQNRRFHEILLDFDNFSLFFVQFYILFNHSNYVYFLSIFVSKYVHIFKKVTNKNLFQTFIISKFRVLFSSYSSFPIPNVALIIIIIISQLVNY